MRKRTKSFERWLCEQQGALPQSALSYVIESLIPFTEANFDLVFRPHAFFNHLDKIGDGRYRRATLRKAYYEARRKDFILVDDYGQPYLSEKAQQSIVPFVPKKLKDACLMVIFDIPESQRHKRRWFRTLLRELRFTRLQQSVWVSEYESRHILSAGILEHKLEKHVRVFEARPIEQ